MYEQKFVSMMLSIKVMKVFDMTHLLQNTCDEREGFKVCKSINRSSLKREKHQSN
jgi:hypothetical protein